MNDKDLFDAQFDKDVRDRIAELESTLYYAEKRRMASSDPAYEYCGPFGGLLVDMRLCDVQYYIDYLKERMGM